MPLVKFKACRRITGKAPFQMFWCIYIHIYNFYTQNEAILFVMLHFAFYIE